MLGKVKIVVRTKDGRDIYKVVQGINAGSPNFRMTFGPDYIAARRCAQSRGIATKSEYDLTPVRE